MRLILFILFFLIAIPIATASSGIFDILNETEYVGSLDIITEYPDPDKTLKFKGDIKYWFSIYGFQDVVRINGTEYYNNSKPLYEYHLSSHKSRSRFIIHKELSYVSGNYTIICIKFTHVYKKRTITGTKTEKRNYIIFTKKLNPELYPKIDRVQSNVVIYNNSFNPHVDIHTPIQPFETKTVFKYQNESITRYTKVGIAEVGAVNLSDCLYWESESDIFKYRNEKAILDTINESGFNPSELEIITYSPYELVAQTNYSISSVQFDTGFKPGLIIPLALLVVFTIGAKKCWSLVGDLI